MRIYLPATLPALARLRETGEVDGSPSRTAHAVTPALREWYAESDLDELEHAAFLDAERTSLRRLAADPRAARLRIVLSADVPDDAVHPVAGDDEDRSVVIVSGVLTLAAVASVHVDEADAVPDVTAALAALGAAADGDEDAQFIVDSAEGHDLLWFDITELDNLLSDLFDVHGGVDE
jgi:hypothetical protein